jgi:hypothetical protein
MVIYKAILIRISADFSLENLQTSRSNEIAIQEYMEQEYMENCMKQAVLHKERKCIETFR